MAKPKSAKKTTSKSTPKSAPKSATPVEAEGVEAACFDRATLVHAAYRSAREAGLGKFDAHKAAEDIADRLRLPDDEGDGGVEVLKCYDLRAEQDYEYPNGARKSLKRGNTVVSRNVADVDTITLHQTAIEFGVSKYAIRFAKGDAELARARRALDVACHAMAFRKGFFVKSHNLLDYVNHAGRFNGRACGLEIEGLYPGLSDDPLTVAREDLLTTWRGEPTILTEDTVEASCNAIEWIVKGISDLGGKISRVVAHRQSSDARRSDPGQEIWERVAVEFCQNEMGLRLDLASPWSQGRPVPVQWDANGIGNY